MQLRDLIRGGIERELAGVEDVHFGLWHVAPIGLRFRRLEGQVVLPPMDQKSGLLFAHPGLPLRIASWTLGLVKRSSPDAPLSVVI